MKKTAFLLHLLILLIVPNRSMGQSKAIYFESQRFHPGGEDLFIPLYIIRDSTKFSWNDSILKIADFVSLTGITWSTKEDFDLFESILLNVLQEKPEKSSPGPHLRIVFINDNLQIREEREICCGDETLLQLAKILRHKEVVYNTFITDIIVRILQHC